jgi:hypothetical protein
MNPDELPIEKPDLPSKQTDDSPFPFDEIIESDRPQTENAEAIEPPQVSETSEVSLVEQLIEEISHDTSAIAVSESLQPKIEQLTEHVSVLELKKQTLEAEIVALRERKSETFAEQVAETQATLAQMVREAMKELEGRKQALEVSIEQLERRRDRIREEMRTSFAGVSQDLAIRVQGFKDYLVGSLQDLAAAAEQLELANAERWETPRERERETTWREPVDDTPRAQFAQQKFQDQTREVQKILEQYRTRPDYYGPPWQLRRTFEPIHAEKVQNWFFSQGGRGSIKSMGSRLQNILIASAIMSVMHKMYGDRARTLVLANTPERLGEWRRGLQDCLGISRSDFGPDRGVTLFESPEALVQKADRLVEKKQLPLVIIDETENEVNLSLLQFPLWLAFAADPQQMSSYGY